MTTDGLICDAPRRGGRKTRHIAEETRQPVPNSAYNPGDNRTKAPDKSWKYFAGDKFPGVITKKGPPAL